MRVAVTVFGSTISPLFDAARRLVVAEVGHGVAQLQCEEEIGSLDLAQRMALLTRLRVKVLACGAISEFSHSALQQRGIEVYPWVSGDVQEVLGILAKRYSARAQAESAARPTRLAIPATGPDVDSLIAPTFRRCSHLVFVDTPSMSWTASKVGNGFAGGEGCHHLTRLTVEAQAQVLLTGRCGPNALGILAVAGVQVIQGVEGAVRDAVAAYTKGSLNARLPGEAITRGDVGRGRQGGRRRRGRSRTGTEAAVEERGHERRWKGAQEGRFDSAALPKESSHRPLSPGLSPVVDADKCSGCRICESVCPTGAVTVSEDTLTARIDPETCIRGGTCIEVCPEQALSMSPCRDGS